MHVLPAAAAAGFKSSKCHSRPPELIAIIPLFLRYPGSSILKEKWRKLKFNSDNYGKSNPKDNSSTFGSVFLRDELAKYLSQKFEGCYETKDFEFGIFDE